MNEDRCVLRIDTTGLNPKLHKIIAVHYRSAGECVHLINDDVSFEEAAEVTEFTGLPLDIFQGKTREGFLCVSLRMMEESLIRLCKDKMIFTYNKKFQDKFLKQHLPAVACFPLFDLTAVHALVEDGRSVDLESPQSLQRALAGVRVDKIKWSSTAGVLCPVPIADGPIYKRRMEELWDATTSLLLRLQ